MPARARRTAAGWLVVGLLLGLAVGLAAFGWWGTRTPAGRQAFDEMDAIIPTAAGALAPLLVVGAAAWGWWLRRQEGRGSCDDRAARRD